MCTGRMRTIPSAAVGHPTQKYFIACLAACNFFFDLARGRSNVLPHYQISTCLGRLALPLSSLDSRKAFQKIQTILIIQRKSVLHRWRALNFFTF